ncbi:MAG: hypothetical protein ABJA35_07850 [Parafilimonas sp.]
MQYSIRMKEAECNKAISANDQLSIDLNKAALTDLKESLAATVKEFNSIPTDHTNDKPVNTKKPRKWWQFFFTLKTETDGK